MPPVRIDIAVSESGAPLIDQTVAALGKLAPAAQQATTGLQGMGVISKATIDTFAAMGLRVDELGRVFNSAGREIQPLSGNLFETTKTATQATAALGGLATATHSLEAATHIGAAGFTGLDKTVAQARGSFLQLNPALAANGTSLDDLLTRFPKLSSNAGAAGAALLQTGTHAEQGRKAVAEMGQSVTGLSGGLESVLKTTAAATLGFSTIQGALSLVSRGISDTVGSLGAFEAALNNAYTNGVRSVAVQEQLRAQILQLPPVLGSATDLAKGLYEVLSSGIKPAESVAFLEQAARLAKAGLSDLDSSTLALTKTMAAYRIPTEQAAEVSEVLFKTVVLGQGHLHAFAQAFPTVTQFSSELGLSLKDTAATLATLSIVFKSPEQAATGFKTFLADITQNMGKFEAAGIDVKAVIAEGGITGLLRELTAVTHGNAVELHNFIPDVRGAQAALALMGPEFKRLVEIQSQYQKNTNEVGTAISLQARGMQESWTAYGNALDRVRQGQGKPFTEFAAALAQTLTATVEQNQKATQSTVTWKDALDALTGAAFHNKEMLVSRNAAIEAAAPLRQAEIKDAYGYGVALKQVSEDVAFLNQAKKIAHEFTQQETEDIAQVQASLKAFHEEAGKKEVHLIDAAQLDDDATKGAESLQRLAALGKVNFGTIAQDAHILRDNILASLGEVPEEAEAIFQQLFAREHADLTLSTQRNITTVTEGLKTIQDASKGLTIIDTAKLATETAAAKAALLELAGGGKVPFGVILADGHKLVDGLRKLLGPDNPIVVSAQEGYEQLKQAASASAEAIPLAFKSAGLKTSTELQATAVEALATFKTILDSGQATPQEIADTWQKDLKLITTAGFKELPPGFEALMAQVLPIFKAAGIELPKPWVTGFGTIDVAIDKTKNNLLALPASFPKLAQEMKVVSDAATVTGEATLKAFEGAVTHIKDTFGALPPSVAAQFDRIAQKAAGVSGDMLLDFVELGRKTPAELQRLSDKAVTAFDEIRAAGVASPREIARFWVEDVAPKVIAAYGKIPPGLSSLNEQMVRQAEETGTKVGNALLSPYAELGLKAPAELQKTADRAAEAFQQISGDADISGKTLVRIFVEDVGPKLIDANGKIPSEWRRQTQDMIARARELGVEIPPILEEALASGVGKGVTRALGALDELGQGLAVAGEKARVVFQASFAAGSAGLLVQLRDKQTELANIPNVVQNAGLEGLANRAAYTKQLTTATLDAIEIITGKLKALGFDASGNPLTGKSPATNPFDPMPAGAGLSAQAGAAEHAILQSGAADKASIQAASLASDRSFSDARTTLQSDERASLKTLQDSLLSDQRDYATSKAALEGESLTAARDVADQKKALDADSMRSARDFVDQAKTLQADSVRSGLDFAQQKHDIDATILRSARDAVDAKNALDAESLASSRTFSAQQQALGEDAQTSARDFADKKRTLADESVDAARNVADRLKALNKQDPQYAETKKALDAESLASSRRVADEQRALDDASVKAAGGFTDQQHALDEASAKAAQEFAVTKRALDAKSLEDARVLADKKKALEEASTKAVQDFATRKRDLDEKSLESARTFAAKKTALDATSLVSARAFTDQLATLATTEQQHLQDSATAKLDIERKYASDLAAIDAQILASKRSFQDQLLASKDGGTTGSASAPGRAVAGGTSAPATAAPSVTGSLGAPGAAILPPGTTGGSGAAALTGGRVFAGSPLAVGGPRPLAGGGSGVAALTGGAAAPAAQVPVPTPQLAPEQGPPASPPLAPQLLQNDRTPLANRPLGDALAPSPAPPLTPQVLRTLIPQPGIAPPSATPGIDPVTQRPYVPGLGSLAAGRPVQRFAEGGIVQGTGGVDSVVIRATPGERISTPQQQAQGDRAISVSFGDIHLHFDMPPGAAPITAEIGEIAAQAFVYKLLPRIKEALRRER